MKKILLVGNGLTSQLIKEYKNDYMMDIFAQEKGEILYKANQLFEPLRHKVNTVNFTSLAWGVCGASDAVCGGNPLLKPVTGLPYNSELLDYIKTALRGMGFTDNSEEILKTYFEEYGLIYETQYAQISSIESLLKAIYLFTEIGEFSEDDVKATKLLANKIYYNNGNFRAKDITDFSRAALHEWFAQFQEIYTTNYDMIIDDTYDSQYGVYHLHGGFSYKNRYKKLTEPTAWNEAYLIWGISGEAKLEQMKSEGIQFPISFPMEFKSSVFESYLKALQNSETEQIHIFGYSGENDQHINNAIANNSNIKEIIYYCSPADASTNIYGSKMYSINQLFNHNKNKKTILCSWNDVWSFLNNQSSLEM